MKSISLSVTLMNKKLKKILIALTASIVLTMAMTTMALADVALPKPTPVTPPTAEELANYKNMTFSDLQKVTKPMPTTAFLETSDGGKGSNGINWLPKDGNIYSYSAPLGKDEATYFYKFLYVGKNEKYASYGFVKEYEFFWLARNGIVENYSAKERSWDVYNLAVCNELAGVSNSSNASTGIKNIGSKVYSGKRLSGTNRIETGVKIAEEVYSGTVKNVLLATGNDFPDALMGSVLANKLQAPVLLTGKYTSDDETIAYIKTHLDKNGTIYVLGVQGLVDEGYITYLKAAGYSNFVRLQGVDKFDTCSKIVAQESIATGTPLVIATGDNYADALSISAVAAAKGYPILLTNKNSLPSEISTILQTVKPSQVYLVGGIGAVSDDVKARVKSLVGLSDNNIIRLSGKNRYETSLNIATHFNFTGDTITFATGENFPDALAGSVLAAKLNAPIILVGNDVTEQKFYINSVKATNEIIFGGTGAVSQDVENQLKGITTSSNTNNSSTKFTPTPNGTPGWTGGSITPNIESVLGLKLPPTLESVLAISIETPDEYLDRGMINNKPIPFDGKMYHTRRVHEFNGITDIFDDFSRNMSDFAVGTTGISKGKSIKRVYNITMKNGKISDYGERIAIMDTFK